MFNRSPSARVGIFFTNEPHDRWEYFSERIFTTLIKTRFAASPIHGSHGRQRLSGQRAAAPLSLSLKFLFPNLRQWFALGMQRPPPNPLSRLGQLLTILIDNERRAARRRKHSQKIRRSPSSRSIAEPKNVAKSYKSWGCSAEYVRTSIAMMTIC